MTFGIDVQPPPSGGGGGTPGADGDDGRTILNGTVNPTTEGVSGDFYLNTATSVLWGPKVAGSGWVSSVSLVGPTGATGAAGKTVRNGTAVPTTEGVDGDFYLRTSTSDLYGPKTAGSWGSPVSLIGATGPSGATGATGATGPPGENLQILGSAASSENLPSLPNGAYPAGGGVVSNDDGHLHVVQEPGDTWLDVGQWRGDDGATGATGPIGGYRYLFSTSTTFADPGAGNLRLNNATYSAATVLSLSETGDGSVAMAPILATWGASTNTTHRGLLTIASEATPTKFVTYVMLGTAADQGAFDSIALSYLAGNGGAFTNGEPVRVTVTRAGDLGETGPIGNTGAPGAPGGNTDAFTFSTSTVDADPGTGVVRFNAATFPATTQVFIDNANAQGASVAAWFASWAAGTGVPKGYLTFRRASAPSTQYGVFLVNTVTAATGYYRLGVTYVTHQGVLDTVSSNALVAFAPTGPAGTPGATGATGSSVLSGAGPPTDGVTGNNGDFYINTTAPMTIYGPRTAGVWGSGQSLVGPPGAGSGDVSGPGSSTNGNLAGFNGTTGKLIADSGYSPADFATAAQGAAATTAVQPGDLGDAAALDVGTTAGTVAAGNDSRLSDARVPTGHAANHADGGSDELALDASQVTTGQFAIGRLASGTPTGSKFVRDDGTLVEPSGGGWRVDVYSLDPAGQFGGVYAADEWTFAAPPLDATAPAGVTLAAILYTGSDPDPDNDAIGSGLFTHQGGGSWTRTESWTIADAGKYVASDYGVFIVLRTVDGINLTTSEKGDLYGPDTATPGNLATFQNTDGKRVQDSGTALTDLATSADLSDYQEIADKDQADGYAGLDSSGKLATSVLPSLAIAETFVVADETEMLATSAQTGDVAIRIDTSETYVLAGVDPSDLGDWIVLAVPPSAVSSVNGQTGNVSLNAANVGAAPVAHSHLLANITNAGGAAALNVGTTAGTVAAGDDSRMTNARTPIAHAATHQNGGPDELALDASQVTTGQFDMGRLASGTPSGDKFVRDDGTLAVPPGSALTAVDGIINDSSGVINFGAVASIDGTVVVRGRPVSSANGVYTASTGASWVKTSNPLADVVFLGPELIPGDQSLLWGQYGPQQLVTANGALDDYELLSTVPSVAFDSALDVFTPVGWLPAPDRFVDYTGAGAVIGQVTLADGWLMHANAGTSDSPIPLPIGEPGWFFADAFSPGVTAAGSQQALWIGQRITMPEDGIPRAVRVYGYADQRYRILEGRNGDYQLLADVTASADGMIEWPLGSDWAAAGDVIDYLACVTVPADESTSIPGQWTYVATPGVSGTTPTSGQIVQVSPTLLRIHETDAGAASRVTELNTLQPGDIVTLSNTDWTILSITDAGTYREAVVADVGYAAISTLGASDVSLTVHADGAQTRAMTTSAFASATELQGVLSDGGAVPAGLAASTTAYGIEAAVAYFSKSDDWDVMAIPHLHPFVAGTGSAGAGAGTPGADGANGLDGLDGLDGVGVYTVDVGWVPGDGLPSGTPIATRILRRRS